MMKKFERVLTALRDILRSVDELKCMDIGHQCVQLPTEGACVAGCRSLSPPVLASRGGIKIRTDFQRERQRTISIRPVAHASRKNHTDNCGAYNVRAVLDGRLASVHSRAAGIGQRCFRDQAIFTQNPNRQQKSYLIFLFQNFSVRQEKIVNIAQ